jgi:C-5 cytosine-specific DNA methylase
MIKNRKYKHAALREESVPYRSNGNGTPNKLRFIDLFCGIGGFRLAFECAGCECVFSSDWNKYAQQTYAANFGESPHGDIHSVAVADIPAHDILCAGFPCQPFSIAGVSKKLSLGKAHGFDDKEQGNLFFSLAEISGATTKAARFKSFTTRSPTRSVTICTRLSLTRKVWCRSTVNASF